MSKHAVRTPMWLASHSVLQFSVTGHRFGFSIFRKIWSVAGMPGPDTRRTIPWYCLSSKQICFFVGDWPKYRRDNATSVSPAHSAFPHVIRWQLKLSKYFDYQSRGTSCMRPKHSRAHVFLIISLSRRDLHNKTKSSRWTKRLWLFVFGWNTRRAALASACRCCPTLT